MLRPPESQALQLAAEGAGGHDRPWKRRQEEGRRWKEGWSEHEESADATFEGKELVEHRSR